jgi:hypothetical protein
MRAGNDAAEVERTSALREAALTGMCKEAGKERPWRRATTTDPLERIAGTLRRLDAHDDRRSAGDRVGRQAPARHA